MNYNKSSHHQSAKNNRASSFKNAAQTYDSIAALTEIMDPSSSHITIPASAGGGIQTRNNVNDPDADSSSTKTEVEEMELDQFSDGEDNNVSSKVSFFWDHSQDMSTNGFPPKKTGL